MIYRNDDVCFGFDAGKYKEVRDIFEEFGLRELYSVIPFGQNIYTPNAHLLSKQELINILGDHVITDDKEADNFIKESLDRGHSIGLHGWKHVLLSHFSADDQLRNICEAKDFLEKRYNTKIRYFIPPFNSYDEGTINACRQLGLQILGRNTSQLEWLVRDNEEIKDEHCWYHAWRFNNPNELRLWLQQRNNPLKP